MTVQPTRDQLREAAEGHLRFGGGGDDLANGTLALLDQLDAAERRIRDLTQEVRDERGAARDQMEQVSIRDARIKAVEDVIDQWQVDGYDALRRRIRRALEG